MKIYGDWKITLPGEEYPFEPDEMMGSECYAVEIESGLDFEDWLDAVNRRNWVACQTLIWFLRRKAGIQSERRDIDFKVRQLRMVQVPKGDEGTEPSENDGSSPSLDSVSDPAILTP